MTLEQKEISRQKQLWASFWLIAGMAISALLLVYFDKAVDSLTGIFGTITASLAAKEGVNLATTPKKDMYK